ncbi:MAG: hypothetical protein AB1656_10230 [Candidatus Omnitrophota bacterium]
MDYNAMDRSHDADPPGGEPAKNMKRQELNPQVFLTWLVLGWCALYACLFLYHGARIILYPYDLDNSEAFLVYQGERLAHGQFLYRSLAEPPYLVDNYPPLYPLLMAAGFYFTGTNFHWPRFLSLAATILTAGILSLWTYKQTRNAKASVFAGLVYLSFYHVYDWCAYARVDAVGCVLAAAGLLIFEKSRSWRAALPWLLAALITRQTLFAAPLAVGASLYCSNRRDALRYLTALAGAGGLLFALLILASRGGAFYHLILYNANAFRMSDVKYYLWHWVTFYTVWGCAPLAILFWRRCSNDLEGGGHPLLFWFVLFSIGEAALCGKIGSAPNYLLSLAAAAAVSAGIVYGAFERLADEPSPQNVHRAPLIFFLCACVFQLGQTWHWPHSKNDFSYTPTQQDAQAGRMVERELAGLEGPVLSDLAGAALMAGHPPVYEPFICTQLSLQGYWDQELLLKRIRNKEFVRAVMWFDLQDRWDGERFTPEMIETLRSHYALERHVGKYYIYAPRI